MLKNLFSKIKSQKASTTKTESKNQININFTDQNSNNQTNLNFKSNLNPEEQNKLRFELCFQVKLKENYVKGSINSVRYWRNKKIPNIFNKVLACPISHYNQLPHSKRKVKEIDLKKDKFPDYLIFLVPLLQQQLPSFNHILINHYPKGIGIMPHFDGPLYNSKVIVLSLGGPVIISFNQSYSKQKKCMQILLQDRSVHIFEKQAYSKFLHGIEDNKVDSFTFRIIVSANNQQHLKIKYKYQDLIQINSLDTNAFQSNNCYIAESSIQNIFQTKSIQQLIAKYLSQLTFKTQSNQYEKYCIEFNQFEGTQKLKGCFIFIKQNSPTQQFQNFKWKIQLQRIQRISITIREKFSQNL